jgi:hypothetical protein
MWTKFIGLTCRFTTFWTEVTILKGLRLANRIFRPKHKITHDRSKNQKNGKGLPEGN